MKKTKIKKIEKVPMTLSVVIAEFDESGSDGMDICNVVRFTNSLSAAKFIVEDFNDSFYDYEDLTGEDVTLDLIQIHNRIKKLKKGENAEWDGPEDAPAWIKWKVFRH